MLLYCMPPLRKERYPKEEPLITPVDEAEDADWVAAALLTLQEPLAADASNVTTTEVAAWLLNVIQENTILRL